MKEMRLNSAELYYVKAVAKRQLLMHDSLEYTIKEHRLIADMRANRKRPRKD